MNIFSGLKVIDVTKVFSGPFATRMLADYGAEVIKIESEDNHDDSRDYPPIKNGWSGYYEILNRNKKNLALNLKNPLDLEKLYVLCQTADVFVENLTPSTKYKLKIDYEILKKINPKLIYASLSGLGQNNDRKYYDVIAQAESGLMSLTGTPDLPMKIGPSVVDAFSGMTLAFAISGALLHREKTGEGQYIDVSMLGCAMNLLESNLIEYSVTKQNPLRTENKDGLIAPFGAYKASDGFIVIAAGNNTLWEKLLSFLKDHAQINESLFISNSLRLMNNETLTSTLENVFSSYSVTALEKILTDLGIPCSKVNDMSDVYLNEDNYTNGFLIKFQHSLLGDIVVPGKSIKFSQSSQEEMKAAPAIGQNNQEYGI